jgi:hypothetical protein
MVYLRLPLKLKASILKKNLPLGFVTQSYGNHLTRRFPQHINQCSCFDFAKAFISF